MEPIRVLQVLASLDRGGAETMIMSVYRNIDRNKIQFDFVVNDNRIEYDYESEIKKLGGRIYRVPKFKIGNSKSYKQAWKTLLDAHPEWLIIHAHHTSSAFIYLSIANSLDRITIAHSHIAGGGGSIKSIIKILMRYPLRFIAQHLFACSNSAAKWMFGKKSLTTHIVNNAIDADKFSFNEVVRKEIRTELKIDNKFVIGHVGRFQTQKNHSFLIDVFKRVCDKNDNAVLLLVGNGELRESIEKKVHDLELTQHVIFTGVRADIPDLLQAMDLFVFPSLFEGLGIVAVEAQAAGLHCIVANTIPKEAHVTNLIEEISLKVKEDNWVENILKYAEGYERKNTYEQIKLSGYDIEKTTSWLESFYLDAKI